MTADLIALIVVSTNEVTQMRVAVHFKYNELALHQLKKFVKPANMRWNGERKEWSMESDKWEAFVLSLDDANLSWRKGGWNANEICDALDILRAAVVTTEA